MFLDIIIIGGFGYKYLPDEYPGIPLEDVEMISIVNGSVLHINTAIPSPPGMLFNFTGATLPNGNLLVRGEYKYFDEYLVFKDGSNQWKKIGASEMALSGPSSVLIDGRFFTTGFHGSTKYELSHHEEFSFDGIIKERRKLPIGLQNHTATIFGQQQILVCGGIDIDVRNRFLNH